MKEKGGILEKGKEKKQDKRKTGRVIAFDNVDAKTAYSLSMFMWTVTHILLKRLAIVGRHKEQHQEEVLTVEKVKELTKDCDAFQVVSIFPFFFSTP